MIRSLYRDVDKFYKESDGDLINRFKRKINKLEKESKDWQQKYYDIQSKYLIYKRDKVSEELYNLNNKEKDDRLMTYSEWCPILEKEKRMKIIDDDGYSQLRRDSRVNDKLTKEEAFKYFIMNTVEFNIWEE